MTVKTRKLIGTVVLLVFSPLAQLAYFVVAGLAWVVPVGLLIRWMQRHDA